MNTKCSLWTNEVWNISQIYFRSRNHLNSASDPPQHARNPPVARHHDLADDPASLVVVRPRVEAAQGLEVAAAEAVAAAAVLAAVAAVVQTAIQLDPDVPLQRTQRVRHHTHMTNAGPPEARAGRRGRGGGVTDGN